jgi:hypothetical protein
MPKEAPLTTMLNNPPDWLKKQLRLCRQAPETYLQPTAASLAYEIFGTATRHEEALAALRARLVR